MRILREPLFQFLLLGGGLFGLYLMVSEAEPDTGDRVTVDTVELERLSDQFKRTWMRPPTEQELAGLAEDFVKEEILYREALALGLDQNDLVIRRRMRQKMEFLSSDLVDQQTPSDETLAEYLDANPELFRLPSRLSFHQIYINPDLHGDTLLPYTESLLKALNTIQPGADAGAPLSDPTLLPEKMENAAAVRVDSVFGNDFAEQLETLPLGHWSGPVQSTYGLHLVRVGERAESILPALEQIRPAVLREWSNEQRQAANEGFYQALRERYVVEIAQPETVAVPSPETQ